MYIPKDYLVDDRSKLYDFIDHHSFGIIVTAKGNQPNASHLPFVLDQEEGYLYSHFARVNSQWEDIQQRDVLVVFPGPHTYVSASWYETNISAPTWNYVAVHVYGRIEIIYEEKEVVGVLKRLVHKFEGPDSSYKLDKSNQAFVEGLLHGIVAFRMKIDKLEGMWKLSQDHSKERQEKVIHQLQKQSRPEAQQIANLMLDNLKH